MMRDSGIIIFDGYCNFCSRSVLFIIRRDKKRYFIFAPSQTPEGQNIIEQYRIGELAQHSIVLIADGKVYRKSTAVLKIARHLGSGWRMFYILMLFPAGFRDLIYDLIARNRYRLFGMNDRCFIPEPGIRERFLPEE